MSTLDLDEQTLSTAFHQIDLESLPDVDRLAKTARTRGRRTRRGRRAVAGAVVAVLAASGGTALLHQRTHDNASVPPVATQPGHHRSKDAKPGGHHAKHHPARAGWPIQLEKAYAVLDADGWTAPPGQPFQADDKLYYVNGNQSLSLNWRPASDAADPGRFGSVVGSATIDGDPAEIRGDLGMATVVGPVKNGRMLTLTGSQSMSIDDLRSLAAQVRRQ